MADLNIKVRDRIKTLREAQALAQPTQALDSTTILTGDFPTQRAKSAQAAADLNTALDKGL